MDNRKFQSAASATPPSAPGSPSTGYPTNGNPGTGTPATLPGEYWFHAIGEEIRSVISVLGGLTPTHATLTQLKDSILGGGSFSIGSGSYIKLPSWLGGVILQWGSISSSGTTSVTLTYPLAFPTVGRCFFQAGSSTVGVVGTTELSGTPLTTVLLHGWRIDTGARMIAVFFYFAIGH